MKAEVHDSTFYTHARTHATHAPRPLTQVLNAVSWAKFGEKSTLDFKWNCIKEKIASTEGIEPRDVSALLRKEADIVVVEKK